MFERKHIISTKDFSRDEIDLILDRAEELEPVARKGHLDLLKNKIIATLFFEPSTRTRLSFDTAVKRLGGSTIGFDTATSTSIAKGETLFDTIKIIESYADAIILRHPREGAARMASEISSVPIINAGDGAGHHPTQTLLDMYTIRKECTKGIGDLNVAIVGDLRYGRTVHSLVYALSLYGTKLSFVAPDQLKMPSNIINYLKRGGIEFFETSDLNKVLEDADVIYMTRIQKERFPDPSEYLKVAGSYRITTDMLAGVKDDMIIMHPLPRVDEIEPGVDSTKHAKYFQQSFYGVPVRMAVLSLVLNAEM
ncbi:aspartate carbamoyltransferase [Methanocella sp. CWC-04]|uniref:Aspartate carbamoyltransferase n=1 Tax=Methanooceanicella nereidis TaxID=2052831 RepID=A0AAP2RD20_9EURY|nr:aspartate carbamoyltransferase [Methanocella sp. CWC-04]